MGRIIQASELEQYVEEFKKDKKKIVLVGGCFDILHAAHIQFLKSAKEQGERLIVLLENDESIKLRKGLNRPINNHLNRASILLHLGFIDLIVLLPKLSSDNDYTELVKKIKPDIIAVTENDPIKDKKEHQAKLVGGKLIEVMKRKQELSTSKLVESII